MHGAHVKKSDFVLLLLYFCNNKPEVSNVTIMVRFSYKNVNQKSLGIYPGSLEF